MEQNKNDAVDPARVRERGAKLEEAARVLKAEFVGLDPIIDGILEAVRSWYLVPELQDRPLVVNLWGMTGVGKTALVSRLAECLGFADRFYRYNLVSEDAGGELASQLGEVLQFDRDEPVIVVLDEFQKGRTKDQAGRELTGRKGSKYLWDFLDSGSVTVSRFGLYHGYDDLYDLCRKAEICLRQGVKVKGGRVVEGKEEYYRIMEINKGRPVWDDGDPPFIPPESRNELRRGAPDLFLSDGEAGDAFAGLDGPDVLLKLRKFFHRSLRNQSVSCRKALVFVIGNLDEVYTMSGDFNPDMKADEFRRRSLAITLPMIKTALQKRFANEQIARLGNIHFIYPAFGEDAYRSIIERKLRLLCEEFRLFSGLSLSIDPSVAELVFQEGVYPVQGARPLLSTLHRVVSSRLGFVCAEALEKSLPADRAEMRYDGEKILVDYFEKDLRVHRAESSHTPELEKLRRPRGDDLQSVVAVHEAGHVVLSWYLLGELPDCVRSVSAGADMQGFTSLRGGRKFIRRGDLRNSVAVLLGGLAAEETLFGRENTTSGSAGDLRQATELAASGFKEWGFGDIPGAYQAEDTGTNLRVHGGEKMNTRVEGLLKESFSLAREVLSRRLPLLVDIADHLADHSRADGETLAEFFRRRDPGFTAPSPEEDGGRCFPYRNELRKAAETVADYN